jgi:hypothetical protein
MGHVVRKLAFWALLLAGCAPSPPAQLELSLLQQGNDVWASALMASHVDYQPPMGRVTKYSPLPSTQYLSVGGQKLTVIDATKPKYGCVLRNLDLSKPLALDWRDTATNLSASNQIMLFEQPLTLKLTEKASRLTLHWKPSWERVQVNTPTTIVEASGDHCEINDFDTPVEVTVTRRRSLADPLKLGGYVEVACIQKEVLKP